MQFQQFIFDKILSKKISHVNEQYKNLSLVKISMSPDLIHEV